jgi:hypothetical protein
MNDLNERLMLPSSRIKGEIEASAAKAYKYGSKKQ